MNESSSSLRSTSYFPVPGSESDDTQSFASHSDVNENLPSIIYTSDDSADIGQPVLNYVDPDFSITHNINQKMEDDISQQFLLESENPSPQSSSQADVCFASNEFPLQELKNGNQLSDVSSGHSGFIPRERLFVDQALQDSKNLLRCISSSSTESTPDGNLFMPEYQPLPIESEDENYVSSLNFAALQDDLVKSRVMSDCKRWYVGNVHINASFKDSFFVKWNWGIIRRTCACLHISLLIGLLFAAVGILIQMPRGSECDPARQWWQGSVSYQIFVPSFQDSDGDGIGDIRGVISRLDYLANLGVKIVRLAPIFESESFFPIPFDTNILPSSLKLLGDSNDIQDLSHLLHQRDMYLILDTPLIKATTSESLYPDSNKTTTESHLNLLEEVPNLLSNWSRMGVDGFAFSDLGRLTHHPDLLPAMQRWRNVLDQHSSGFHRRILIVPIDLLLTIKETTSNEIPHLLSIVDMIDAHLNLSSSAKKVGSLIREATNWSNHPTLPWINWSFGGMGRPRLLEQIPSAGTSDCNITTIGPLLLQLYLPGSVNLYYGDEIALYPPDHTNFENLGWASLMPWTGGSKNGGFSSGEPWLPPSKNWRENNVASLNPSLEPLRAMIKATQNEVPMYINGIVSNDNGPKQEPNFEIRKAEKNLMVLERFYPRRHTYAVVINLGKGIEVTDLSYLYYGGNVIASSHRKAGYIHFKNLTLYPGEAVACVLDK